MITLVEAGLDWNPLEARSAHNQRQTKDFRSFSGFYLGGRNESCTAHQLNQPPTEFAVWQQFLLRFAVVVCPVEDANEEPTVFKWKYKLETLATESVALS
jgi:hypothetical protein